ncbi:MFS transporter [Sporothrix schenckii 1099-18]|uniref:Major facilitator superfamily (MFS) profile domain-containing protein n=2 Tax=Sporothrix schenckii TaxID=29908 RepID=U7PMS7_SPOS1|nr:MFS transporter [Sporothrix schenckii 1099-18]ERS96913.1 hypothetical protein HMPREF1624_06240 [Sporothrix schenckii ATCC 58251]KJR86099.1 MFS transporter [Sporothrix schenckii 1099-18]
MAATDWDWAESHPEKRWAMIMKLKRFTLWSLYISIGSMMLGFDFSLAGTLTAFPSFQQLMGVPYAAEPSGYLITARVQSAWSAISTVGDIVGIVISSLIMDRIGRKHTIFFGIVFTSVGIGMQIASHEWTLFLGGRLVNAVGFGVVYVVCPVWIGENVRPELRGLFLCFINGSIILGQFILSLIAYGTQHIEGKWSYESLIVLQFTYVFFLIIGYPFFPESPYFLLSKRKDAAAAEKQLRRIYGSSNPALLTAELARIQRLVDEDESAKRLTRAQGPLIQQCFQGTNLKRTLISLIPPATQQFIGAAFVLGYITYFLSLLHIQNYFTVSVVLYVVMFLSNASAFPLIEVVGRRPLMIVGIFSLTVIEFLMGIMGVVNNAAALWVTLVCIFLWALAYQVTVGAVGLAVAAEVATPRLRPITISLVGCMQGVSGWLIGFVSPYLINPDAGNLGAKVGFVFAGFGVPLCILIYFYIPETKGLSFEDLDMLFANKVSTRHFTREVYRLRAQRDAAEARAIDKNGSNSIGESKEAGVVTEMEEKDTV